MLNSSINKIFSGKRFLIPVFIGLTVIVYLLYSTFNEKKYYQVTQGTGDYIWIDGNTNNLVDFGKDLDFEKRVNGDYKRQDFFTAWQQLNWSSTVFLCLFVALLMIVIRDLAYMWRIRVLSDQKLSWKQSFKVIMVWEFASALTPGVVGGAAVAMFILHREKISLAKSTTIVMITAFLDELFYVLIVPVFIILIGASTFFPDHFFESGQIFSSGIGYLFWFAYSLVFLITLILYITIFIRPILISKLLIFIGKIPGIRKFKNRLENLGNEIQLTSVEMKNKSFSFWFKAFLATVLSWTSRFLVLNFVLLAFNPLMEHLVVFARQLSMWLILLISPTPGGSGIAELALSGFLKDFIPFGLVGIIALIWRLISYYLYLIVGAVLVPFWLKQTSSEQNKTNT